MTDIDKAILRIEQHLDPDWQVDVSYSLRSGWRVHIVLRADTSRCAKTVSRSTLARALLAMEQFVAANTALPR